MDDDRYRWIGQSSGTLGAEYDAVANWMDLTTGASPALTIPGAADAIVFDAVPQSSGIVSLLGAETASAMAVVDGASIELLAGSAIPENVISTPETLSVQSLAVGTGGAADSGSVGAYGVALDVAGGVTLHNALLAAQPDSAGGIVVDDPSFTPHAEVHVGAGGTITASGTSAIADLTDSGLVTVTGGTLSIVNIGGITGGVSGSGTIDVMGDATLDVSNAAFYNNFATNSIGVLTLAAGAVLNLGSDNLRIGSDFVNDNAGAGNSYDPTAGVVFQHVPIAPGPVQNGTTTVITGGNLLGGGAHITLGGDAQPGSSATATLDLGSFHIGQTVAGSYTIANSGTAGAAALRGAIQTDVNGASIADAGLSGSGVTAQNFGPIAAGATSQPYGVMLHADHAGTGTLAQLVLPTDFSDSGTVTLDIIGTGYNYAIPEFVQAGGVGTLTHAGSDWTLDLGTLAQGSSAGTADIAVANGASGLADQLAGSFDVTGSGFAVSGAAPFGTLADDGSTTTPIAITPNTMQAGTHTETILLAPTGSNASGYSAALPGQTLTVSDTVSTSAISGPGSIGTLLGDFEMKLESLFGTLQPAGLLGDLQAALGSLDSGALSTELMHAVPSLDLSSLLHHP